MKYVMLINDDPAQWDAVPEEQVKQDYEAIYAYVEKWRERGKWADQGNQLDHPRTARTIRHNGTAPVVTDGPFTDTKEVVGGYMVLDAVDLDEAVAIASEWPTLHYGGSIEVRPLVEMP